MMVEIIEKKRAGRVLLKEEIETFVQGYTKGEIPDYQASALMMAICFAGMNAQETADLTDAMMRSGKTMDFSDLGVKVADKHSTGGVADTTTLILVPLMATVGVRMAKMSGRGLGFTGGTIDKLESIPGFRTDLDTGEIKRLLMQNGGVITSQSDELAPADKKMYALRDVTATVDSIPLIASSIMSKKLALGTELILLDVKTGSGAFMQNTEDAFTLAQTMVDIGTRLNRNVAALITNMSQPLGNLIGNALEVREAIEVLSGQHLDSDLFKVTAALGVRLLSMAQIESDETKANDLLLTAIRSGKALETFERIIQAQGGDARVCETPKLLGEARRIVEVKADQSGTVRAVDAASIGRAAQMLGAGRETLEDTIDPLVGIEMRVRMGDAVNSGDVLALLHVDDEKNVSQVVGRLQSAIEIGEKPDGLLLIRGVVTPKGQTRY